MLSEEQIRNEIRALTIKIKEHEDFIQSVVDKRLTILDELSKKYPNQTFYITLNEVQIQNSKKLIRRYETERKTLYSVLEGKPKRFRN